MSKPLVNIHDAFFKQALSDPQLAGTFLREHLPSDVAALLGNEPPEPLPVSFVDEELRQHHSDLLFRVRLNTGDDACPLSGTHWSIWRRWMTGRCPGKRVCERS
jgi:hypothetical protein